MSDRARLPRQIGLGGALLLSFNGAVGAGIFALPATLAADFGSFAPWLFPIVALGTLLIAIPFARTAAAFPESGGPATYGRVFGRISGFELGWIYYISRAAAFAANANVLLAYLGRWILGIDDGPARIAALVIVCAGFALANIVGVKRALQLLAGFTLLKALPLIAVAIAALVMFQPVPAGNPPPLGEIEAAVLIVFYAFLGFENVVVPAGETRRAAATLPRAILLTLAITTLLYFLVQLAFVTAFPDGGADPDSPLIDLGSRVAGPAGALIVTAAAIASLAGNLHSNLAATPRVTFALADRGDLPLWFSAVQPRFATPANSIAFFAGLTAVLAVTGSFVWLAAVSVLSRLIVYIVAIAALPLAPDQKRPSLVLWIAGTAAIILCSYAAFQADAKAWWTLAALAAAGLVLYAWSASRRKVADQ